MVSLQRLLGRSGEFFGLLESSAGLCRTAVAELHRLMTRRDEPFTLEAIHAARREDKAVITRLEERLVRVLVTPLEREDLEQIAQGLYRIPKIVEKFAERYEIVRDRVSEVDFALESRMFLRAVEVVEEMVKVLSRDGSVADIKAMEARLAQIESDGTHVLMEATRKLCLPGIDPLTIVIAKELLDILSDGIECCSALGHIIALVLLKHS